MSEETLHTAARRAVRFFNIDMNKGGLITEETESAMFTLAQMVEIENAKSKRHEEIQKRDAPLREQERPEGQKP